MRAALKQVLDGLTAQAVADRAYSNPEAFGILMEVCRELGVTNHVDLTEAWNDCLEDVNNWGKAHYSPWEDDRVPGDVAKFINMLHELQPAELARPGAKEKMAHVMTALVERSEDESNTYYERPKDNDERSKRADGYETLWSTTTTISDQWLGG